MPRSFFTLLICGALPTLSSTHEWSGRQSEWSMHSARPLAGRTGDPVECEPSQRYSYSSIYYCIESRRNEDAKSGYMTFVYLENRGAKDLIYTLTIVRNAGETRRWKDWPLEAGEDDHWSLDAAGLRSLAIAYREK
jgi:hypothetical protein